MTTPLDLLICQLNCYNEILHALHHHDVDQSIKDDIIHIILRSIHNYSIIPNIEYKFIYDEDRNIVELTKI